MIRFLTGTASMVLLTGCNVLFPEDPRLGSEESDACVARVEQELRLELANTAGNDNTVWVPTFTYDITKLSLEAIQDLSSSNSDETEGTRLDRTTNETSTAVDTFMQQDVDENGSFFLGRQPALYRVRGRPARFADVVAAGCARQQENMRLIDIDLASTAAAASAPEATSETNSETEN